MGYPDHVVRGAWSGISTIAAKYTNGEWPFDGSMQEWVDRSLSPESAWVLSSRPTDSGKPHAEQLPTGTKGTGCPGGPAISGESVDAELDVVALPGFAGDGCLAVLGGLPGCSGLPLVGDGRRHDHDRDSLPQGPGRGWADAPRPVPDHVAIEQVGTSAVAGAECFRPRRGSVSAARRGLHGGVADDVVGDRERTFRNSRRPVRHEAHARQEPFALSIREGRRRAATHSGVVEGLRLGCLPDEHRAVALPSCLHRRTGRRRHPQG